MASSIEQSSNINSSMDVDDESSNSLLDPSSALILDNHHQHHHHRCLSNTSSIFFDYLFQSTECRHLSPNKQQLLRHYFNCFASTAARSSYYYGLDSFAYC